MIQRLRLKFVSIIMGIVVFMLLVMFAMVYHGTKLNLENDSLRMMRGIAATTVMERRPNEITKEVRLPFFTVRLGSQGGIVATGGGYYDLSDREFLEEVVQQVITSGKHSGTISEYNLRFCLLETPGSQLLVFADTSSEQATLKNLLMNCLWVGMASVLVFLGLSLYLSKWAVAPIERAWNQQKQFVADASHELKTPLTIITANAELLQQENSERSCGCFAETILTTSQRMRTLLEQMLELARSEGQQRLSGQRIDFTELVNDEVLSFEAVLYEKGHSLWAQVEKGQIVWGDGAQLRRVVTILLDNAGKYAEPGSEIRLEVAKWGKKHCRLSVENPGPPIQEEELKQIFKRFYRLDEARAQDGSYGLGLAIAQSVVQRHRGKIWAESRKGRNRFLVELPTL